MLYKFIIISAFLLGALVSVVHARQDEDRERFRNYNPDSLVRALIGIEPINETSMKPDDRHIRIWWEFGSTSLFELSFIQKIDSNYVGGSYIYWAYLSFDMDEVAAERDRLQEDMGHRCAEFRVAPSIITCRQALQYEPDWAEILEAASEAGIFTIPPFDSLRIPIIEYEDGTSTFPGGFGGTSYKIETFDGEVYKREVYLPGWIEEDSAEMELLYRPLGAIFTRIPFVRSE